MIRIFSPEEKRRIKATVYMKDTRVYLGVDLAPESTDDRYFIFWISDTRMLAVQHIDIDRISYYVEGPEES